MKETNISAIMKFLIICSGTVTLGVFTQIATFSFLQELSHCGRVIMHYEVSLYIMTITLFVTCGSIGISSKLDFGESQSPKVVTTTSFKPVPTPYKHYKKEEPTFTNIGVVCTSGEGCNTTKANETGDTIETDVVVHVKTNINRNEKNKTDYEAETPDVPVVTGTSDRDNEARVSTTSYGPFDNSGLYTKSLLVPSTEPRVELNVVPQITPNSNRRFWYNANGLKMDVPRFEPTYQKHYYGENSPPSVYWYPGRSNFGYQTKPASKPSVWSYHTYEVPNHKHQDGSGVTCSCKNEATPGLQWNPNRRTYGTEPGRQINDKLAPLN